jgi:hypothetical protein
MSYLGHLIGSTESTKWFRWSYGGRIDILVG